METERLGATYRNQAKLWIKKWHKEEQEEAEKEMTTRFTPTSKWVTALSLKDSSKH